MAMVVYGFINTYLYPFFFQFQSGSVVARHLNETKPSSIVYVPEDGPASYSLEFYLKQPVKQDNIDSLLLALRGNNAVAFMPKSMYDTLGIVGNQQLELQEFKHFHISQLTLDFLNYKTRENALTPFVLVKLKR